MKSNNIDNIASYLESDSDRQLYSGVSLFTFVLGNTDMRDTELLGNLYSQGFSPTRLDLAYGIQMDFPEDLLLSLTEEISSFSDNPQQEVDAQITQMIASRFHANVLRLWFEKTGRFYDSLDEVLVSFQDRL